MKKLKKSRVRWRPGDWCSLLFPQRCPLCDGALPFAPRLNAPLPQPFGPDVWVHPACHKQLKWVRDPACLRCGRPVDSDGTVFCRDCLRRTFHFESNTALWVYDGMTRGSVSRFKYHGRQQYAVYYARALWTAHAEKIRSMEAQAILPVPIHRDRLRKRGYNQAALIAWELEKLSGIPCREDILIRSKHTGAQKELGPAERLKNMENAFRIRKKPEGIHTVIIVDDIFTTGSTLEAMSRVLLGAGVRRIFCFTLCIAGPEGI